jgi:hypothetical protein
MTVSDYMIVFATLLGPILAVQAQKWIERAGERRNAQKRIFTTLMATRATIVSPDHVQALNMIELDFGKSRWGGPSRREKKVLMKWKEYADHLNTPTPDDDKAAVSAWLRKQEDMLVELLDALGTALGYDFDRVNLKRGIYYPRAHGEQERRKDTFERALIAILTGEASLPMSVTSVAHDEETLALQKKVQEALAKVLAGEGTIRVKTEA